MNKQNTHIFTAILTPVQQLAIRSVSEWASLYRSWEFVCVNSIRDVNLNLTITIYPPRSLFTR